MAFLTILEVTEILCSFRLVLEGKTGKEITESSRLEFLEEFSANNFALSDEEDNTSRPLNRGGITDLPLLRTLLGICQKSWEPSFWEVMDSLSMETETTVWSEFPNGGKAIVEQILALEETNISRRAGLWESQSGIQVGKLTIK